MIRRGAQRTFLATITAISLVSAGVADARPRRHDAKVAFDRGVAAYQKSNYDAAAEALGKSFELERDVDTLFAWAQAERKLEHCGKAIELYEILLSYALPPANKTVVEQKLAECRAIAAQGAPEPATSAGAAQPSPSLPEPSPESAPAPSAAWPPRASGRPPSLVSDTGAQPGGWYSDPIAWTLLGSGAVASAVGTWFLVSAQSASNDAKLATVYQDSLDLRSRARQRGMIGTVAVISGGALLAGGVVWILLRPSPAERRTVTGWLAPGGGGLAIGGSL